MTNLKKLMLAVGLALAAAVLNALWLSAEKQPPRFVAALGDLAAGEPISDAFLTPVPIPGDFNELRASLIPYANRAILFGLPAQRDYTQGDVFFQRDIQAPVERVKFEVLGPFRLISVGERFKQADLQDADVGIAQGTNNVTIAVSANFDDRTRRLLEIIDPSREQRAASRIVAVQVIPAGDNEARRFNQESSEADVVYQTVSLAGIENVPQVLLAGEVVRFVIPAENKL